MSRAWCLVALVPILLSGCGIRGQDTEANGDETKSDARKMEIEGAVRSVTIHLSVTATRANESVNVPEHTAAVYKFDRTGAIVERDTYWSDGTRHLSEQRTKVSTATSEIGGPGEPRWVLVSVRKLTIAECAVDGDKVSIYRVFTRGQAPSRAARETLVRLVKSGGTTLTPSATKISFGAVSPTGMGTTSSSGGGEGAQFDAHGNQTLRVDRLTLTPKTGLTATMAVTAKRVIAYWQ